MTRDEFLDAQYKISFIAGMNQRYHQRLASWLAWSDRGVRIVVGFLAVASLVLSLAKQSSTFSIAITLAGAVAAMILNIVPLGEWHRDHVDIFRRWSDLREEIDILAVGVPESVSDEFIARLRCLESKMHRICGSEPHGWSAVLKKCESAERLSRGETITGRAA
jgi:hypothetical protein